MESRYALREIQGAIGRDCRKLEDGRRAVFRHTHLHKAARRYILERADLITVMYSSVISASAVASHHRIDVKSALDRIIESRRELINVAFPYFDLDKKQEDVSNEEYDKYFDMLEKIEKEKEEKKKNEVKKEEKKPEDMPMSVCVSVGGNDWK